jgi:hypothetical protein
MSNNTGEPLKPFILPPIPISIPLEYIVLSDYSNITNIILIDNQVKQYNLFYNNCNSNTFPIVYDKSSKSDELITFLTTNFLSIDRLCFIFDELHVIDTKIFIDNNPFYTNEDLIEKSFDNLSSNMKLIINLCNQFNIKNVDYLACNTLNYPKWVDYYAQLNTMTITETNHTGIIVGASNDNTGNIKYGGNWLLESIAQNIEFTYFISGITNYANTLAITTLSANLSIEISQNSSTNELNCIIDSSPTPQTISKSNWPIQIQNTGSTVITVTFNTDININSTFASSGTDAYFSCVTKDITFNGNNNNYSVIITDVSGYSGLIQNGQNMTLSYENITVNNITVNSVSSTLFSDLSSKAGGWVCQQYFGNYIAGCLVQNCSSNGNISNYGGGILGSFSFADVSGCYSSGDIGSLSGGIVGANLQIPASNLSGTNTCRVTNCYSTGKIASQGGGIMGGFINTSFYQSTIHTGTSQFIVTNCNSTGDFIGQYAGGICGQYCNSYSNSGINICKAINCYSIGNMNSSDCGGIYGDHCNYSNSGGNNTCVAENCYSTGNMNFRECGGIVGPYGGGNNSLTNTIDVSGCYSTGAINDVGCGGIYGAFTCYYASGTTTCSATNCYSTGDMNFSECGGIYGKNTFLNSNSGTNICIANNCYSTGNMINSSCGGIYSNIASTYISSTAKAEHCYTCGLGTSTISGIFASSASDNPTTTYYTGRYNYSEVNNSGTSGWIDTNASATSPSSNGLLMEISGIPIWISIYLNTPYLLLSYDTNFYNGDVISDSVYVYIYTTLTTKYNPLTSSPYPEDFEILGDPTITIDSSGNMESDISGSHFFKILRGFKYTSPTPTIITPSIITSPPGTYIGYNIINFILYVNTPIPPIPPTPPTPPTPSTPSTLSLVIYSTPITYNINTKCKKNTTKKIKLLAKSHISTKLKFYIKSNPEHGTAIIKNNKVYYTPNNDYIGNDKFTYYCKNSLKIKSNVSKVNIKVKEYSS